MGEVVSLGVLSENLVYDRFLGKLRLEKRFKGFLFFSLFFSPFVHAWKSLSDSSLSTLFGSIRSSVRLRLSILRTSFTVDLILV